MLKEKDIKLLITSVATAISEAHKQRDALTIGNGDCVILHSFYTKTISDLTKLYVRLVKAQASVLNKTYKPHGYANV